MKTVSKFLAFAAIVVCFAFALPGKEKAKTITVVIDAGHGGKDLGAAHEAFTEKQITDAISSKIKLLNTDKDVVIHFTRQGDNFVGLNERVQAMNNVKPDLVLSLHVNYTKNDDKSGMEFFINKDSKGAVKATDYAERLSEAFEKNGYKVTDLKSAPFYILKNSEAPSVVVELGYLSNEIDRTYLTSEKSQNDIAKLVLDFLKEIK